MVYNVHLMSFEIALRADELVRQASQAMILTPSEEQELRAHFIERELLISSGEQPKPEIIPPQNNVTIGMTEASRQPNIRNIISKAGPVVSKYGALKVLTGAADSNLCAKVGNPDLFSTDEKTSKAKIDVAKSVCANCLSLVTCREGNLDNTDSMIYGGLTRAERMRIKHLGKIVSR